MEKLIKKYIAIPMAVTVFKQGKDKFQEFKLGNLYIDLLDEIIERMQQDFYQLKSEIYSIHHVYVKSLDSGKYKANGEIIGFSSEELKEITRQVMSEYLSGDKLISFERKIEYGRMNKPLDRRLIQFGASSKVKVV